MSYRSSPAFAIGGVKAEFKCSVCGKDAVSIDQHAVRGICEKHCSDHDYEYDGFAGDHFCVHCGAVREYEPSDDDVGFGSFGSYGDAPLGVPASAMNGNASEANTNPAAWERWVAFCDANGHP